MVCMWRKITETINAAKEDEILTKVMLQTLNTGYKQWLENPDRNTNGYEYEQSFVEQMQKMGKELFQDSIGEQPASRNLKKKSKLPLGK